MDLYKALVCVFLTTILVTDIVFAAPSVSRDLTKFESAPLGISKAISNLKLEAVKSRTKRRVKSSRFHIIRRCLRERKERNLSDFCRRFFNRGSRNNQETVIIIYEWTRGNHNWLAIDRIKMVKMTKWGKTSFKYQGQHQKSVKNGQSFLHVYRSTSINYRKEE